jgi:hypothetical protein
MDKGYRGKDKTTEGIHNDSPGKECSGEKVENHIEREDGGRRKG